MVSRRTPTFLLIVPVLNLLAVGIFLVYTQTLPSLIPRFHLRGHRDHNGRVNILKEKFPKPVQGTKQ